jgi:di/tricarboxylate transporter
MMLQRGEHAFFYPFDGEITIKTGDILVIIATKSVLMEIIKNKPQLILENSYVTEQNQSDNIANEQSILAEVVVAPASRMIGQTLEQLSFRYFSSTIVLGIQRRDHVIKQQLWQIKLQAGDVMLILGNREALKNIEAQKELLLLSPTIEEIPNRNLITRVNMIAILTITLAITGTVPILVSAIFGVTLLIITKSISVQQAVRALDMQVFLVISAAYMMSLVIEKTGGVQFIVSKILSITSGMTPVGVMSVLFLIIVFFNELISNNATGLIFTPIVLEIGGRLNSDPRLFIWGLIIAGSCCFATPIGYQTNLLVMAPGRYRFFDYIKAGLPLSLLIWISYTGFAYIYF